MKEDDAPYGYCPICGGKGISRERYFNGNDVCQLRHTYKSKNAVRKVYTDKDREREIIRIAEIIGYGRLMQIASSSWGKKESTRGGNFVLGPCESSTVPCGCESGCDWCRGCQWLTKHVKKIKDKRGQDEN